MINKNNYFSRIFLIGYIIIISNIAYAQSADIVTEYQNNLMTNNGPLMVNLDTAIGIAIYNNYDLKKIEAQGLLNKLTTVEKFRNFFPTLGISYMETEENKIRDLDSKQHKITFDSEVLIYDGGKTKLSYDVAKLQSSLSRNDYKIALNQFITQISNAYFKVIQLRQVIGIHTSTLEQGNIQLNLIRREKELGEATTLDVLEIETQIKEIELNLKKAYDDYSNALNEFKILLKINYKQNLLLIGDIEKDFVFSPVPRDISLDDYIAIAIKNRKEVESAELEFQINEKQFYMNKYYFLPNVSVGLNYNLTDERFLPRDKGWGVTLKVSSAFFGNNASANMGYTQSTNENSKAISNNGTMNILSNIGYKKGIYESQINLNAAQENRNIIRQKIALEITQSYLSLINSWDMIEISRKRLELYDSQLVIERLKADMGEIRRYDLIKKEIEKSQAAVAYSDSLQKYLVSASSFENGIGVNVGFLKLAEVKSENNKENK